jgi:hypothetical protein
MATSHGKFPVSSGSWQARARQAIEPAAAPGGVGLFRQTRDTHCLHDSFKVFGPADDRAFLDVREPHAGKQLSVHGASLAGFVVASSQGVVAAGRTSSRA